VAFLSHTIVRLRAWLALRAVRVSWRKIIASAGGYDAAPVPVMANVASAGGAGSRGSQAISFAPQFNMPLRLLRLVLIWPSARATVAGGGPR